MISPETLYTRLESVVGRHGVWVEDAQTATCAIAFHQPVAVVRPETVEQAAEIVTLAGRERLAVVPWGQGTQMHLGQVPERYDLALSLAGLRRIVEYDVANLTVIVEAGLPLCEVYRVSVPERQFLPLGCAGTTASLGGLLVTNTSGVKRGRYGSLRDLLLGVRVALPDGALVRFGGRVVKNVAGYDMNKLFVGSLGAFGVVLETTYRLAALPEDDCVLAVVFPTLARAAAVAATIQESQLLPSAILLLHADAVAACTVMSHLSVSAEQVVLVLNFDGTHEAVERQVRDSRSYCQQHGGLHEALLTGEALLSLWEFQEAWRAAPRSAEPERLQVRLGILPGRLEDAVQQLSLSLAFCQRGVRWLADYSAGQIFAHLPLEQPPAADLSRALSAWLQQVRTQMRAWQGYCVVEYAPAVLRQQLDIWGEAHGQQLLRLYKQRFDPQVVLNPGRYVAGL
jgi:glycolate dehydrogenase FAD-binding subunit